jgi:hypothetical protein
MSVDKEELLKREINLSEGRASDITGSRSYVDADESSHTSVEQGEVEIHVDDEVEYKLYC